VAVTEKLNPDRVLLLKHGDASALAGLRLTPGLEVAEDGDQLWLRFDGGRLAEAEHRALRQPSRTTGGGAALAATNPPAAVSLAKQFAALPAVGRFECLPSGELLPLDQRVPVRRLPALAWQPIARWLQVTAPASAFPGSPPRPVALKLVRSHVEQEPDMLTCGLDEFLAFSRQAAQVRLESLQFAARQDGRVQIRGRPLPPLPGRRFVMHRGIAVPAGFTWEPAVSVEVLARCFAVNGDTLVLWNEDGTITRLHGEQFVPATRSAVRLTHLAVNQRA